MVVGRASPLFAWVVTHSVTTMNGYYYLYFSSPGDDGPVYALISSRRAMHDRHSRQRDTRGVAGHIDLVLQAGVFTSARLAGFGGSLYAHYLNDVSL